MTDTVNLSVSYDTAQRRLDALSDATIDALLGQTIAFGDRTDVQTALLVAYADNYRDLDPDVTVHDDGRIAHAEYHGTAAINPIAVLQAIGLTDTPRFAEQLATVGAPRPLVDIIPTTSPKAWGSTVDNALTAFRRHCNQAPGDPVTVYGPGDPTTVVVPQRASLTDIVVVVSAASGIQRTNPTPAAKLPADTRALLRWIGGEAEQLLAGHHLARR